jgi:hypothetical protein
MVDLPEPLLQEGLDSWPIREGDLALQLDHPVEQVLAQERADVLRHRAGRLNTRRFSLAIQRSSLAIR